VLLLTALRADGFCLLLPVVLLVVLPVALPVMLPCLQAASI
jgi:hypothetical protein